MESPLSSSAERVNAVNDDQFNMPRYQSHAPLESKAVTTSPHSISPHVSTLHNPVEGRRWGLS